GGLVVERAETRIEGGEPGIDELDRQDLDVEEVADPHMAFGIAPEPIARVERLAAEEGIARPPEMGPGRQRPHPEPVLPRPALEVRRLALPDSEPEPRAHEELVVDQARVGGEDQVRQAWDRLEPLDRRAELAQVVVQRPPLVERLRGVAADLPV